MAVSMAHQFIAPNPQAFVSDPLEHVIASQLTTRDSPFAAVMLNSLMNRRDDASDQYMKTLGGINSMQGMLANRMLGLQADESARNSAVDLATKGGSGGGGVADVSNLLPLHGLLGDVNTAVDRDNLNRSGVQATTLKDLGAGLNTMSEAGVNLNPGQQLNPLQAGSLQRVLATTGEPRNITAAREAANVPKITVDAPGVPSPLGPTNIHSQASTPAAAVAGATAAQGGVQGRSSVLPPSAPVVQQQAAQAAATHAQTQGTKIVSQVTQGNNVLITYEKPVPYYVSGQVRQAKTVLITPDGKTAVQ